MLNKKNFEIFLITFTSFTLTFIASKNFEEDKDIVMKYLKALCPFVY